MMNKNALLQRQLLFLFHSFTMEGIKIVTFVFLLLGFQLYAVECQSCKIENNVNGRIVVGGNYYNKQDCWTVPVPLGYFAHLQITNMQSQHSCSQDYVKITIAGIRDVYKFCSSDGNKNPVTAFDNVTITHYVSSSYSRYTAFNLEYTIKTMECLNKNSFKCDNNTCVSEERVCDGVKDCKNGADEIGCETGVLSIKGVPEAREKAISWMKQKRTPAWGWKSNTPRAVVALYLASGASFNGTVLEEELMAKQTELKTAVALLRPSLTNSELSMLINALLVTCHSPRQFYGNNLVKRLKEQVEESGNFTHPLAYLTLCNANESWPLRAISDLNSILSSDSEYPFVKDLQAMAITALSCQANRSRHVENTLRHPTLTLYKKTIQNFKKLQALDGSFGNAYTTALITQALLSSGQEHSKDWKLNATIKYLIKELNSSTVDFLVTYLTLPILNGKSLMDISYVNCSANPRKHGDDPVSEINDYLGPKIRVQYSLYIGDDKDVVHTISLRVPENYTASEVMELAEVEDPKYKFEWKMISGKMYVYELASVTNDPEAGKFWLLYVGAPNSTETLTHLTKGPDEIIMGDEEHLVLWYKTATI
ncbi:uncharacterized protein CG3556-like [Argiope bruennichi]|uniref:uncharacterized protein CG3556-like n=1 Tax=Argiope bruennichi TaxID=94029 RepID=UPI002494B4B9|nr:uncharacterized protein CG3556-like [Argiope bruennichi]